jgi:predicted dehydrogenase
MNENTNNLTTRRDFIKTTGRIAAVSALAGVVIPHVHAAENNTIQVALVGCGGRGTGAADNCMMVNNGPIKLVAMADVFESKLKSSYQALSKNEQYGSRVEVPEDHKFIGFDGYKKAMDCLKAGDVVILATPPAFRWVHFKYAIEKGLNVFMEKPVTVDGPTSKRMLLLAEEAKKKNLKVGVGLMCRHCVVRQELFDRIKQGEIGDIVTLQAFRMHAPVAACYSTPQDWNKKESELLFQIERFHGFLWASGGLYSDFYIHNIDECCWMKDAWPVKASALGGRNYRENSIDQNFDSYSVEYTFDDGTKLFLSGRAMEGCHEEFASHALGTKGSAIISTSSHTPSKSRIYKGYDFSSKAKPTWSWPKKEPNPYQLEWNDLIDAIRTDKAYNEVERGVKASLVTSMGRMAAHTGQVVTYDEILNCGHEFAPDLEKLTMDSPAPLLAGADGKYPIPMPGIKKDREY